MPQVVCSYFDLLVFCPCGKGRSLKHVHFFLVWFKKFDGFDFEFVNIVSFQ